MNTGWEDAVKIVSFVLTITVVGTGLLSAGKSLRFAIINSICVVQSFVAAVYLWTGILPLDSVVLTRPHPLIHSWYTGSRWVLLLFQDVGIVSNSCLSCVNQWAIDTIRSMTSQMFWTLILMLVIVFIHVFLPLSVYNKKITQRRDCREILTSLFPGIELTILILFYQGMTVSALCLVFGGYLYSIPWFSVSIICVIVWVIGLVAIYFNWIQRFLNVQLRATFQPKDSWGSNLQCVIATHWKCSDSIVLNYYSWMFSEYTDASYYFLGFETVRYGFISLLCAIPIAVGSCDSKELRWIYLAMGVVDCAYLALLQRKKPFHSRWTSASQYFQVAAHAILSGVYCVWSFLPGRLAGADIAVVALLFIVQLMMVARVFAALAMSCIPTSDSGVPASAVLPEENYIERSPLKSAQSNVASDDESFLASQSGSHIFGGHRLCSTTKGWAATAEGNPQVAEEHLPIDWDSDGGNNNSAMANCYHSETIYEKDSGVVEPNEWAPVGNSQQGPYEMVYIPPVATQSEYQYSYGDDRSIYSLRSPIKSTISNFQTEKAYDSVVITEPPVSPDVLHKYSRPPPTSSSCSAYSNVCAGLIRR